MGSTIIKKVETDSGVNELKFQMESNFPWDGQVKIKVNATEKTKATIALRIPDWCKQYEISKVSDAEVEIKDGYYYITKEWEDEVISLNFPMEFKFVKANPKIREDIGKIALVRGPVVYCLEEADNGKDLHLIHIPSSIKITETIREEFNLTFPVGNGTGLKLKTDSLPGDLYFEAVDEEYETVNLQWIPYYLWANRGEGEMQVWSNYTK
jgi:DUF1680 family protein